MDVIVNMIKVSCSGHGRYVPFFLGKLKGKKYSKNDYEKWDFLDKTNKHSLNFVALHTCIYCKLNFVLVW